MSRSRHAVRSHAMGWLRVRRSPATASRPFTVPRNGERTSWPGHVPDDPAALDVLALGDVAQPA